MVASRTSPQALRWRGWIAASPRARSAKAASSESATCAVESAVARSSVSVMCSMVVDRGQCAPAARSRNAVAVGEAEVLLHVDAHGYAQPIGVEPLAVQRQHLAGLEQLLERAVDELAQRHVALGQHEGVGFDGEEAAGDLELV